MRAEIWCKQRGTEVVISEDARVEREELSVEVSARGDDLILVLPENGSTGYVWAVEDEESAGLISSTTRGPTEHPLAFGSAYERVLTLSSPAAGDTRRVTVVLGRPWIEGCAVRKVVLTLTA